MKKTNLPWRVVRQNSEDSLSHHGILGQKWGIRRFQNKDGSLTKAGLRRLRKMSDDEVRSEQARSKLEEDYKRQLINTASIGRKEKSNNQNNNPSQNNQNNPVQQSPKKESMVGKLLKGAAEDLGRKTLGKIVEKAIGKIFKDPDGIDKYSFSDPTKASLKDLQDANKWFEAMNKYKEKKIKYDDNARTEKRAADAADWVADIISNISNNSGAFKRAAEDAEERRKKKWVESVFSQPLALPAPEIEWADTSTDSYKSSESIRPIDSEALCHYGAKGQKWGVRRYETYDGHLTAAGIARYVQDGGTEDDKHDSKYVADKTGGAKASAAKAEASTKYMGSKKGSAQFDRLGNPIDKSNKKGGGVIEDPNAAQASDKKKKGGGGKKSSGGKGASSTGKKDWRERFADKLKEANLTPEELEEALNQLYPDRKKKTGDVGHGDMSSNDTNFYIVRNNADIIHYGVKGMRRGVRRYTNDDGSLTEAGKRRYYDDYTGGTSATRGMENRPTVSFKRKRRIDAAYTVDSSSVTPGARPTGRKYRVDTSVTSNASKRPASTARNLHGTSSSADNERRVDAGKENRRKLLTSDNGLYSSMSEKKQYREDRKSADNKAGHGTNYDFVTESYEKKKEKSKSVFDKVERFISKTKVATSKKVDKGKKWLKKLFGG